MTGPDEFPDRKGDGGLSGSTSQTLLEHVKKNDAEAWRRIDFLYTPLVRWWCRSLAQQDAEDLAQEVWRAVHRDVENFSRRGQGSFRRWLFTITRSKIADLHRRRARRPERAVGGADAQRRMEGVPDVPAETPSDEQATSELAILVRRAIEWVRPNCSPKTWEAAWRLVVDQHDPSRVAADLGMTVGAVHTARSRVLSRLREVLEPFGELHG